MILLSANTFNIILIPTIFYIHINVYIYLKKIGGSKHEVFPVTPHFRIIFKFNGWSSDMDTL